MQIIHSLGRERIAKDVNSDVGFLLTNRLGDYFSAGNFGHRPLLRPGEPDNLLPSSRYHGWFVAFEDGLYKIIDNLEVEDAPAPDELRNNFWHIERVRGNFTEDFFTPFHQHALVYEMNDPRFVTLVLDVRPSYVHPQLGRFYEIDEESGVIIVRYSQPEQPDVYLAVKPDRMEYAKIGEWIKRSYELDRKRSSLPFEKYVYKTLRLKAKKIVFAVSRSKDEAMKVAEEVFRTAKKLRKEREASLIKTTPASRKIKSDEIRMAYLCAANSLDGLLVNRADASGIFAGLPWFFQFWSLDEAISVGALKKNRSADIKKIITRQLSVIRDDGRMPSKFSGEGVSASAAGWLFKRILQMTSRSGGEASLGKFNEKETDNIRKKIGAVVDALLQFHTYEGFDITGSRETWMDTQDRSGARIEIQALRIVIYDLAFHLTQQTKYYQLKKDLADNVKDKFWNDRILADGWGDFTIRPNIFLAAYICPDMLSNEDWTACFERVLPKLWLEWGGLATIDKESPLFVPAHSGEDPGSYHNGDSWFYLNNLAALVLFANDSKRFDEYICAILEANTREILWHGIIGHHAELSSAESFRSEGSWVQAWSAALFVEALDAILGC